MPNEGIHTMNKRTIPDIAEELRAHINTDNDAKRLICEHVLPLVGIDGATPQELEARSEAEELLTSIKTDLEDMLDTHADDGLPAELIEGLKDLIETIP